MPGGIDGILSEAGHFVWALSIAAPRAEAGRFIAIATIVDLGTY